LLSGWRLYLDECVDGKAATALLGMGIDTTSAHGQARIAESDSSQLRFAAGAGRTLLSHDTDFLSESVTFLGAGGHHAGILLAPDRQDLKWLLKAIKQSLETWDPEELRDQVRWLLAPTDRE
jgi:hypothetical protein